jgi:hypothetical protein
VEQNEKDLMDYGFQLRQKELDLDREYAPKILNAIPSQKMMMLRKAEDDFRSSGRNARKRRISANLVRFIVIRVSSGKFKRLFRTSRIVISTIQIS